MTRKISLRVITILLSAFCIIGSISSHTVFAGSGSNGAGGLPRDNSTGRGVSSIRSDISDSSPFIAESGTLGPSDPRNTDNVPQTLAANRTWRINITNRRRKSTISGQPDANSNTDGGTNAPFETQVSNFVRGTIGGIKGYILDKYRKYVTDADWGFSAGAAYRPPYA